MNEPRSTQESVRRLFVSTCVVGAIACGSSETPGRDATGGGGATSTGGIGASAGTSGSGGLVGAGGSAGASGVGGGAGDACGGCKPGELCLLVKCTSPASIQQAYVKASNTGAGDLFGYYVALSADGNTLAVGAPIEASAATGVGGDETSDVATSSGAVYVFIRSGGSWSQEAYIKASNTGAWDEFGWSVALSADGDTLAVGAPVEQSAATGVDGDQTDNSTVVSGAAYVFVRSGGTWSQQAYVKASNTGSNDIFGSRLALTADGNTLAVAAPGEWSNATGVNGDQTNNAAYGSGAVYVLTRSGNSWSQQAYIKASNTDAGDNFGTSLALSANGNTLAVGALHESSAATGVGGDQTSNTLETSGAAYVFVRTGSDWSQQAYIKASNTETYDSFSWSLALSADGNTLAVGAFESSGATGVNGDQTSNAAQSSGAAYVFARAGSDWSQQAYIKASNAGASDFFGWSVALSGDGAVLAVGAAYEQSAATGLNGDQADNAANHSGATYVFTKNGVSWAQQAYIKASNTDDSDNFGLSLALSADGKTLAVAAPYESSAATSVGGDQTNNAATGSGAVYVF